MRAQCRIAHVSRGSVVILGWVFGSLCTGREGACRGACNSGNLRLPTAAPQRSYPLDAAQWRPVTMYGSPERETYKQEVPGSSPGPPTGRNACKSSRPRCAGHLPRDPRDASFRRVVRSPTMFSAAWVGTTFHPISAHTTATGRNPGGLRQPRPEGMAVRSWLASRGDPLLPRAEPARAGRPAAVRERRAWRTDETGTGSNAASGSGATESQSAVAGRSGAASCPRSIGFGRVVVRTARCRVRARWFRSAIGGAR
jgi:hypothetical protein